MRFLSDLARPIVDRVLQAAGVRGRGSSQRTTMQGIEIADVRAVVVFSNQPEELAGWYRKVFALDQFVTTADFVGLATGSGLAIFIQRSSEGHAPGIGGIRPHFTVADCQHTFRELLAAGAQRVLLAPTDTGDEWVAAVQDPEGNPVGLLAPKGGK
jgi:predicted enzyme related to lactoylglutathione lyase